MGGKVRNIVKCKREVKRCHWTVTMKSLVTQSDWNVKAEKEMEGMDVERVI